MDICGEIDDHKKDPSNDDHQNDGNKGKGKDEKN